MRVKKLSTIAVISCGRAEAADPGAAAAPADSPETVSIVYVEADGTERAVEAEVGMNLMDVAHANNVELEGTCEKMQQSRKPRRMKYMPKSLCLVSRGCLLHNSLLLNCDNRPCFFSFWIGNRRVRRGARVQHLSPDLPPGRVRHAAPHGGRRGRHAGLGVRGDRNVKARVPDQGPEGHGRVEGACMIVRRPKEYLFVLDA